MDLTLPSFIKLYTKPLSYPKFQLNLLNGVEKLFNWCLTEAINLHDSASETGANRDEKCLVDDEIVINDEKCIQCTSVAEMHASEITFDTKTYTADYWDCVGTFSNIRSLNVSALSSVCSLRSASQITIDGSYNDSRGKHVTNNIILSEEFPFGLSDIGNNNYKVDNADINSWNDKVLSNRNEEINYKETDITNIGDSGDANRKIQFLPAFTQVAEVTTSYRITETTGIASVNREEIPSTEKPARGGVFQNPKIPFLKAPTFVRVSEVTNSYHITETTNTDGTNRIINFNKGAVQKIPPLKISAFSTLTEATASYHITYTTNRNNVANDVVIPKVPALSGVSEAPTKHQRMKTVYRNSMNNKTAVPKIPPPKIIAINDASEVPTEHQPSNVTNISNMNNKRALPKMPPQKIPKFSINHIKEKTNRNTNDYEKATPAITYLKLPPVWCGSVVTSDNEIDEETTSSSGYQAIIAASAKVLELARRSEKNYGGHSARGISRNISQDTLEYSSLSTDATATNTTPEDSEGAYPEISSQNIKHTRKQPPIKQSSNHGKQLPMQQNSHHGRQTLMQQSDYHERPPIRQSSLHEKPMRKSSGHKKQATMEQSSYHVKQPPMQQGCSCRHSHGIESPMEEKRRKQPPPMEGRRIKQPLMEENRRKQTIIEENRIKQSLMEPTRRKQPTIEDNYRKKPAVVESRRKQSPIELTTRKQPLLEDNRRKQPPREGNRKKKPLVEENYRKQPAVEENYRMQPPTEVDQSIQAILDKAPDNSSSYTQYTTSDTITNINYDDEGKGDESSSDTKLSPPDLPSKPPGKGILKEQPSRKTLKQRFHSIKGMLKDSLHSIGTIRMRKREASPTRTGKIPTKLSKMFVPFKKSKSFLSDKSTKDKHILGGKGKKKRAHIVCLNNSTSKKLKEDMMDAIYPQIYDHPTNERRKEVVIDPCDTIRSIYPIIKKQKRITNPNELKICMNPTSKKLKEEIMNPTIPKVFIDRTTKQYSNIMIDPSEPIRHINESAKKNKEPFSIVLDPLVNEKFMLVSNKDTPPKFSSTPDQFKFICKGCKPNTKNPSDQIEFICKGCKPEINNPGCDKLEIICKGCTPNTTDPGCDQDEIISNSCKSKTVNPECDQAQFICRGCKPEANNPRCDQVENVYNSRKPKENKRTCDQIALMCDGFKSNIHNPTYDQVEIVNKGCKPKKNKPTYDQIELMFNGFKPTNKSACSDQVEVVYDRCKSETNKPTCDQVALMGDGCEPKTNDPTYDQSEIANVRDGCKLIQPEQKEKSGKYLYVMYEYRVVSSTYTNH